MIVFGRRGGKQMATFIPENDHVPLPPQPEDFARKLVDSLYSSTGGESAARVRSTLQNEMDVSVFVERDETGLRHALDTLCGVQEAHTRVALHAKGKNFHTAHASAIPLIF